MKTNWYTCTNVRHVHVHNIVNKKSESIGLERNISTDDEITISRTTRIDLYTNNEEKFSLVFIGHKENVYTERWLFSACMAIDVAVSDNTMKHYILYT